MVHKKGLATRPDVSIGCGVGGSALSCHVPYLVHQVPLRLKHLALIVNIVAVIFKLYF